MCNDTTPNKGNPVLLTFAVGKYAHRMDLRLLASAAFVVMRNNFV